MLDGWRQMIHPVLRAVFIVAGFVLAAELGILFVPPAYAFSIPVGNLFVIDLGEIPIWIGSFVVLATWWDSHQAKKLAAASLAASLVNHETISGVGEKIDGMLADRDRAKVSEGEAKGQVAAEKTAETLAEGQRQGAERERASVAAANTPTALAQDAGNGGEVPVKDGRVAAATERMADASDRSASATEKVAKAAVEKK